MAINEEFNETNNRIYCIYSEDSISEPVKPYFEIMDISPNRKPLLDKYYMYNELIMVQYHGEDNNTSRFANLYEVSERLSDCLEVVNGIRATNTDSKIVDGVLSFQANFKFRAKEIVEETPIQRVEISTKAE